MRVLAFVLLTAPLWGLSNAVTVSTTTEVPASQVTRIPRWFAQGEIASYPQPFVSNVGAAAWQVDVKNRWPDGSVRFALVHFTEAIAANSSITVHFRNSANACHLGNQATCEAAGLDGAGMLAFNGGWDAEIEASADPVGSTTSFSANARTMLTANHFTYWLRGPLVTAVIAEDASVARVYDGGWLGTGCTAPYSTCTWTNDTTFRSLHPMFVLTFNQNAGVRIEFIVANYWTTARQDQRYSVVLKTSAGAAFTKTSIYSASNSWWRKELWDGDAPVQTSIDFNLEYLRHSRMIPPYRLGITVPVSNVPAGGSHNINSTLSYYASTTDANHPFFCTPGNGGCSSRMTWYPNVGGRPDRGFYPLWEAHWLYSMRRDVHDVVVGAAAALGSQYTHHREAGTGLTNYHGSTAALGQPVSINTRTAYNSWGGGTGGLPAAVGPVSTSKNTWRGWEIDAHHRHSHAQLAYLITGDWWFMQEQSFLGHVILGWGDPSLGLAGTTTYARRSPWGMTYHEGPNHRGLAWQIWNLWSASFIVPDADPQSAYLKEKMRDVIAQYEGYYDVRDGDFYQPCTTEPFDVSNEQSKWCRGRNVDGHGRPTHLKYTPLRANSASQTPPTDSNNSGWMTNYIRMAFFLACHGEGLGCGIARYHADGYKLAVTTPGSNPSIFQAYLHRLTIVNSTTLTAPLASSQTATTIPVADASVCAEPLPFTIQIGGEWIWIVGKSGNNLIAGSNRYGGRRYLSTAIGSHASGATVNCPRQPVDWAELTSITDDKDAVLVAHTANGGDSSYESLICATGRWSEDFNGSSTAAHIFNANCHDNGPDGVLSMYSNYSDPRWLFEAYRAIDRVRVTVAAGTATLKYVAPSGAACRVHVGTAPPATSNDSGDPLDEVNGRVHGFTAAGLSAGTHHYRISCGPVRATGTFAVE